MKYDQFIKQVQSIAQLSHREEAERATQATLETLKERILGDEASQLAAQLPHEFGQYLQGREGEMGEYFRLNEFIQRVSQREGVEPEVAKKHAQAVFAVLQAAVTPGEFADVRVNLSEDFAEMFATQSESSMS